MNFNRERRRPIWVLFISLLFLFSATTLPEAGEVRGVTNNTLMIGLIADMTGPTATDISGPIVMGLRTYFRYINDQGGIHGRKVKLIVEDDRYVIPHAVAAFKKLVFKDNILALEGPLSSASAFALLRQIEKNGLPTISYSPSDRMVVPLQKYVFTCNGLYEDDIRILFNYILKREKRPSIALVYPDLEVGLAALRAATEEARHNNLKLHTEILNIGAIDATSQVLNLKRAKAKHIIIQGPAGGGVVMLRAATKLALHAKYYGTTVTSNEDIIEMGGVAVKDYLGTHQYTSWYDKYPGSVKVRETMIKYHKKIPIKSRLLCMGWVGGMVLKKGLDKAGRDVDGERLRDAVEGIRNLDTEGLTGPISYSTKDHKGLDYAKIFKPDLERKVFVAITDWIKAAK